MRKILFASTALVAAGLLTAGSAEASDKINLQLGGFSKWWVVGAWDSSNFNAATTATNTVGTAVNTGGAVQGTPSAFNNANVKGDNEVWFGGSTKLDNGLKVGVDIHLEAGGHTDATTDTIDKSYIYVEGGFGKFIVGTQKNGTYLLHVAAPDAAGNWGEGGIMTGNYAIKAPAGVNQLAGGSTTASNTSNNSEAITYVAPTFYGLTVGGSYLPHAGIEDSRSVVNLNQTTVQIGTASPAEIYGGIQEAYGVGALYANTFGGVGVKVSAGLIQAKLAPELNGSWFEQSYGSQLSYAGFTLGGSYRNQRHNYNGATQSVVDVASLGNISSTFGSFASGSGWDAGLSYATGPYAVSLSYFRSSVNHDDLGTADVAAGTTGHDVVKFYQLSGKYNLGPGVDLLGSAGYAVYNGAIGATAAQAALGQTPNQNSGWTVMSGVSLTF